MPQPLWIGRFAAVGLVAIVSTFFAPNASAENTKVMVETSAGDILIELFDDKAPISVKNFLSYVKKGHYEGTIFHRVIKDFMIQTGGLDKNMTEKSTGAGIKNESSNGLKNVKYSVAMARKPDLDSATAQFYINTKDNKDLDGKYCVFGKVLKGDDVVDKIAAVKTTRRGPHENVPIEVITIKKISVVEPE